MEIIKGYKISDGRIFQSIDEATAAEAEFNFIEWFHTQSWPSTHNIKPKALYKWLKENKEMAKMIAEAD